MRRSSALNSTQSYTTGGVGLIELIDSQRLLLDAKLTLAEARAGREKRLAELEALAGVDIETLGVSPQPAEQNSSSRAAAAFFDSWLESTTLVIHGKLQQ